MSMEVHVDGRITDAKLSAFLEGVQRYQTYARDHGYAVPAVLQGLSGPMNSIRLVYRYDELNGYEDHEARALRDPGYADAASGMAFAAGSITYTVFRRVE